MSVKKIFLYFVIWRLFILLFQFLGVLYLPLQNQFLGGNLEVYTTNPYIWSLVNFDGEHFLSIAQHGYQPLTYFYFPLYPYLTKLIGLRFGGTQLDYVITGLFISHLTFFIGLVGFVKLLRRKHSVKFTEKAIIILLIFPTSFYFASYYSESLFFCLTVWTFYLFQNKKFYSSALTGVAALLSRFVGIAIVPSLVAESFVKYISEQKNLFLKALIASLAMSIGIFAYMYYLYSVTGDPLEFFHNIDLFGAQRSTKLVLLPQVFYRYLFKILPNINYNYFPAVFFTYLELLVGILLTIYSVLAYFKLKLSYAVYISLSFIIPALSGSFSSVPRYAITIFPIFILTGIVLPYFKKPFRMFYYLISFILWGVATTLFTRGYWIS